MRSWQGNTQGKAKVEVGKNNLDKKVQSGQTRGGEHGRFKDTPGTENKEKSRAWSINQSSLVYTMQLNTIAILLWSRTLTTLAVNSYHALRLIEIEVATVLKSIPGAVLVTHDSIREKWPKTWSDLQRLLHWHQLRHAEQIGITRQRGSNSFYWLEFIQVVHQREKELGFWVIRVPGCRTTEWFVPSQLIFDSREGTRELRWRKKPELLLFPQRKYSHWLGIWIKLRKNSGHCDVFFMCSLPVVAECLTN